MSDHVTEIDTKQGLARWTREHADEPVHWETKAGPGGIIVIIEHETTVE